MPYHWANVFPVGTGLSWDHVLDDCRMILRLRGYSPCRGFKHCFNVTFSYFLLSFLIFKIFRLFSFKISLVPALPGALWRLSVVDALRASSLYVLWYVTAIHPPTYFSFFPVDFMPVFCCFGPVWGHRVLVSSRLLVAVNKCWFQK